MKEKIKEKRKNVALLPFRHNQLLQLSEKTGITMTALLDFAVQRLLKNPPTGIGRP